MPPSHQETRDHVNRIREIVGQGVANDLVSRSWARCLNDYGLDPFGTRLPGVLTHSALTQRRERAASLIDSARVPMDMLYEQLADPDVAVVLVDRDGVILHLLSDAGLEGDLAPLGMRPGAIWSEREAGTNGMGTCLAAAAPVAIRQHDHFYSSYASLTCSAMPVLDQLGEFAAVLNVTTRSMLPQNHSLALIGMTARIIENRLLDASYGHAYPIHFHSARDYLYTAHEGKLMVDADGLVLAANRSALDLLGYTSQSVLRGRRLDEIFHSPLPDILQRSMRNSFHPVPVYRANASTSFFAVAQYPRESAARPTSVIAAGPRNGVRAQDAASPVAGGVAHAMAGSHAVATAQAATARVELGDPCIAEQFVIARRVIARGVPLVLCGETGAGKEIFAKALHRESTRSNGPFVAVNCGSLPESLIESELFGYRAGAFTGAQRQGRRGKVLQADKGTLFLDEIGDMPLALQARLLRVLDERQVTPLGSETPVEVDLQLISASHRNLVELVRSGQFREDLYYRLNGVEISLPALRERADKLALIRHMVQEEAGMPLRVEPEAEALLLDYAWPGNLRQMRHVLRTMVALREGDLLGMRQLPALLRGQVAKAAATAAPATGGVAAGESSVATNMAGTAATHSHPASVSADVCPQAAAAVPAFAGTASASAGAVPGSAAAAAALNPIQANERVVLLRLLEGHRWNISQVAKSLAISRNTLYRKLHRLNISLSSDGTADRC